MIIKKLNPETDVDRFIRLRREALDMVPPVFGETPAAFSALSREEVATRLSDDGRGNFVLGATPEGREDLVGMAGLYYERGPRFAHRANVWGFLCRLPFEVRGSGKL